MKHISMLLAALMILLFSGCGQPSPAAEAPQDPAAPNAQPSGPFSPKHEPPPAPAQAEESAARETLPLEPLAASGTAAGNAFALDPAENFSLYAYHAPLMGYTYLGYTHSRETSQPAMEAAIAAVNALPVLTPVDAVPAGSAAYGLMSVANDGSYAKTQYFLYENYLTVNGTAYPITASQYAALKAVMEAGAATASPTPRWFVYMNPARVVSVACTDESGRMQETIPENLLYSAFELQDITVSGATTYLLGAKELQSLPFRAVYTFDNGVTYTVYVSDVTLFQDGVTFYVESSDMSYGCEYVCDGYISYYVRATQIMIDGPANVRMG